MGKTVYATTLDLSEGNVIGLRLQGRLSDHDITPVVKELETTIAEHDRIHLLLELRELHGVTPETFWQELPFSESHLARCDRLALVAEDEWLRLPIPSPHPEVRQFRFEELRDAWSWLKS